MLLCDNELITKMNIFRQVYNSDIQTVTLTSLHLLIIFPNYVTVNKFHKQSCKYVITLELLICDKPVPFT